MANCAKISPEGNFRWRDDACYLGGGTCLCESSPLLHLKLRGLCANSAVDKYYQPMNNFSNFDELRFVGIRQSWIEYDETSKVWNLSVAESNVRGLSIAAKSTFLLGKHKWTIDGDSDCSTEAEKDTSKYLKLTGCVEGDFTCDDGQCVTMEQRCNQLPDCRDLSDEENCSILGFGTSYNMNIPPVISQEKKVNISISIDLLKIVDIKEEEYSIQFSISLQWKENRVKYHNLKTKTALNALTYADFSKLWLPKVIYENTDQKATTRLGEVGNGEWETRVVVKRERNFTRSELNVVDEIEVFEGSENSLIMNQTYTHEFQCSFDFSRYPFDHQVHL